MENGKTVTAVHKYDRPGDFTIRAQARDTDGALSDWEPLKAVTVEGEQDIKMITPPYLQNMMPDSIVIMCETDIDTQLEVHFGTTTDYGRIVPTEREPSGGDTWIHRALLVGLESGGEYHYRILSRGVAQSEDRVFRTTITNSVDFSFGVWSDSQGSNHDRWTADPWEPTTSMMKHMAASGIAFGLTAGDLAENGLKYFNVSDSYLRRVARHLGGVVPWYVAWGNHDKGDVDGVIRRFSDLPSRYREGLSPGHGSYAFTYAGCHFVCLDYFHQPEITDGWLEQTLGSSEAQEARFRFLVNHVPPYCELWIDGDAGLRENLVPLLEKHRVSAIFSGHTHEYERGFLNGVHYIVSGGGSWLDFPPAAELARDWEHMTVGGAHDVPGFWAQEESKGVLGKPAPISRGLFNQYLYASVRGDTLTIECRAFNADGSYIGVLDTVTIKSPK